MNLVALLLTPSYILRSIMSPNQHPMLRGPRLSESVM